MQQSQQPQHAVQNVVRPQLEHLAYNCAQEISEPHILTARQWCELVDRGAEIKDVFNGTLSCPALVQRWSFHLCNISQRLLQENNKNCNVKPIDLLLSLVVPEEDFDSNCKRFQALSAFMEIANMDYELNENLTYKVGMSKTTLSVLAMRRDCALSEWVNSYNIVPCTSIALQSDNDWRSAYGLFTQHTLYSFVQNEDGW